MTSTNTSSSQGSQRGDKSFYTTPNPFERAFGYHRAVRKGPFIFVSGTTALKVSTEPDGKTSDADGTSKVEHPGDAGAQAALIFQRCVQAVEKLGGKKEDVVRVRMYVAAHDDCEAVGQAYKNCFASSTDNKVETESENGHVTPGAGIGTAATMVVIQNGYVDPDILVEIEMDAVCS